MRTRFKICGFTDVDSAVYAAHLGVDAIGLVFYANSSRHVSIEKAIEITQALPPFTSVVGLFVNADENEIRNVLAQVPLDYLQFHGDEPAADCRIYGKRYIKAISMKAGLNFDALNSEYHDAKGLLLDAYHPDAKGGTGTLFDWALIPAKRPIPIILAGGLTVQNIKRAIQIAHPYAVDVSSGVELEKGKKDIVKMTAFTQQVQEGDRETL
ncbi:MAG: phosphoribosylanthranilate isomerase [Methylococcaceae bacterium]